MSLQRENQESETPEKELRWKTAFLEAQIASSLDGILVVNSDGKKLLQNERLNDLWKIPEEIRRDPNDAAQLDFATGMVKNPEQFMRRVEHLYSHPTELGHEEIELKDGTILDRHSFPVVGKDGTHYGRLWTFRDITERKKAEERLRRTEELYRRAIEGAEAVPYAYDYQTRGYLFIGEGIEKLIGYKTSEVCAALWGKIIQESVMLGETAGLSKEEARMRVMKGELRTWRCDMRVATRDGRTRWVSDVSIQNLDEKGRPTGSMGILQDITERKEAEAEMESLNRRLLEASRQAGMAEVATGVLHNVGNILNSVNVTATLVEDQFRASRVGDVARVVELFRSQNSSLAEFLTQDPKGKRIPEFLSQLAEKLGEEQAMALKELESLRRNVEHIKEIVAMQQSYAKVSGVTESLDVRELIEDALRMNSAALVRHQIEIRRDFQTAPPIESDRHKVLQILVNLIRNAKYACEDSGRAGKEITLRLAHANERVRISVLDNGIGIPIENLTRIFSHGFTTRKDGHGFGLHSGANAARELGGSLTVQSEGHGKGACFTLELPGGNSETKGAGASDTIGDKPQGNNLI